MNLEILIDFNIYKYMNIDAMSSDFSYLMFKDIS